jgi:hypothetical protein
MKVLLDECIPRTVKKYFPDRECQTVPQAGVGRRSGQVILWYVMSAPFTIMLLESALRP